MPEKAIRVGITDLSEFHCFSIWIKPPNAPQPIEIMLHATTLVNLIHECSVALCEWQRATSQSLILQKTGLSESEARQRGLIA